MRLDPAQSLLLVVDVQERLVPAMRESEDFLAHVGALVEIAGLLAVPVLATEQAPEKLGATHADLIARLVPTGADRVAKSTFSAYGAPEVRAWLQARRTERPHVVLAGLESHICVQQTALDLLAEGFRAWAVEDAIAARHDMGYRVGLARMGQAGAIAACVESVAFEWLGGAEHPAFRRVQALVKDMPS